MYGDVDLKMENVVFIFPPEQYLSWLVMKILLHFFFSSENHIVRENSDANMIKKLITFLFGYCKICFFVF